MSRLKLHTRTLLLAVATLLWGCVDDSSGSSDEEQGNVSAENFDFSRMFANYADNIIIANYQAVVNQASAIASVTGPLANYCTAIGTAAESATFESAQTAWQSTQAAIQQSEGHILGPVTDNNNLLLNRLNVYNSSDLSRCGIDQAVVLASADANLDVTLRTTNQRGIGAVEYLLFNTQLSHTCPSQIIETQTWNARPADQRKRLRCDYALKLSADISDAAQDLVQAWSATGSNYRSIFINPNNNATSLEALSDAMFYMDLDVKDKKLGIPTGISDDCPTVSCIDEIESPYSENSLVNIRNNLQTFDIMLTGANGLGFDDLIAQKGLSDLNDDFSTNIDAAISAIDAMPSSLLSQVATINSGSDEAACNNAFANPSSPSSFPVCNLYGLIKVITDDLKVGFVTAVDVDLPERGQSDND